MLGRNDYAIYSKQQGNLSILRINIYVLSQKILRNITRQLRDQLGVHELLSSRRPRDVGSFLDNGFAFVAVMA